jgi:NCS1 family nucleobase:cation symporter-1
MDDIKYNSENALVVEPHGIEYIKLDERHGKASKLFSIWFASNMHLSTWTLGALAIILGLDFWSAVYSVLIGNLIGALAVGLCVSMGPRLGMPQMVSSRASFGYKGNYLPACLASIGFLGWFTVNNILGGQIISQLIHLPFVLGMLILAVLTLIMAIYGYNMINSFQVFMTAFSGLVFIIMTILIIVHGFNSSLPATVVGGKYWSTFFLMLTIAFSYTVGWAPYGADYGRYLDPETPFSQTFIYSVLGLFVSISWIMIVGIMVATVASKIDPIAMIGQTMGWFAIVAFIALVLGSISSNVLNMYSGSLSMLTLDLPFKRMNMSIILGVVSLILCSVIGYTSFLSFFKDFLLFLCYWITPWLGILLVEFYIFSGRGKKYSNFLDFYNKKGPFGSINYRGLVSYIVGIACSVPFMASSIYTGPIGKALGEADFSYFVAFIIAAVLYYASSKQKQISKDPKMSA